jgi:MFS family permease
VSNLGDGTSAIAYPWLASTLTRSPVLIAGVGVASRLPWLLVSLHAGAVIDRSDRRLVMIVTNTVRALITLVVVALIATDLMTIPALFIAALLLGVAEVLYDNAAQTILPRLVPEDRLERANGNLWGAETVTNQFVGPPLGGLLIAIGLAVPFALDAASFGLSAFLILAITGSYRASVAIADDAAATGGPRLRDDIAEGFRWLWRHRLLRDLAVTLGVMNLASAAAYATFVLFAQEVLDLGATGFGVLTTAGAVGAVLGSLLAADVTARIGAGPSLQLTLWSGVVTSVVIGLTSSPVVVGLMSVVFGFGAVLWNVITVSLRQSIIPDHLLGRVNSVYRFFGWGGMPLGALLGGALVRYGEPLTDRLTALRLPFLVCGGLHLLTVVALRGRLRSGDIAAAKAAATEPAA